jgi:hypothetical protein
MPDLGVHDARSRCSRCADLSVHDAPIPVFTIGRFPHLTERGLTRAYRSRPAYQRNDYIGWITSAKGEASQRKRSSQMLRELAGGRTYRKMKWSGPRAQTASGSR